MNIQISIKLYSILILLLGGYTATSQTFEVENMSLLGYEIVSDTEASEGSTVALTSSYGNAKLAVANDAGASDLTVIYQYEEKGECLFEIYINGDLVDAWLAKEYLEILAPSETPFVTHITRNITLKKGDEIEIVGYSNNSEKAILDKVVIEQSISSTFPTTLSLTANGTIESMLLNDQEQITSGSGIDFKVFSGSKLDTYTLGEGTQLGDVVYLTDRYGKVNFMFRVEKFQHHVRLKLIGLDRVPRNDNSFGLRLEIPYVTAINYVILDEENAIEITDKNQQLTIDWVNLSNRGLIPGGYIAFYAEGTEEENQLALDEIKKQTPYYESEDAIITNATIKDDETASGAQYVDGNPDFNLSFSVDEPAGESLLSFTVKSVSGERSMGVYVNESKVGVITAINNIWTNQIITANLKEGENIIEIRDSEGTDELDIDYLFITNTQNSLTFEEKEIGFCDYDGIIESSYESYTGEGFVNSSNFLGAGVEWNIDGSAGEYRFKWRYASASDRPANLFINGIKQTVEVSFPSTESWANWGNTAEVTVKLEAGIKTISLEATVDAGLGNIDNMQVNGPSLTASNCEAETIQEITLNKGWNLVSLYIEPVDRLTGTVFPNAEIVKTFDVFYSSSQPEFLNTLTEIKVGEGYLVYNSIDETITISGVETHSRAFLQDGWNLIGVPSSTPIPVSDYPGAEIIKDFDSFYKKGDDLHTLTELFPGKAYFILTE